MIRAILDRSRRPAFSAALFASSPSGRDPIGNGVLVAGAIAAGVIGWSGNPLTLPAAMAFPALWGMVPSRWSAALVSTGYFLAASRGLPQGAANFYGSELALGVALWLAASLAFVGVHTLLWTARLGWRRPVHYAVAAVLMSVPPFGIVGWANPITAAGILFPEWGWFGLVTAAIIMLILTTRQFWIAAALLGGMWTWSAANWTPPNLLEGWVGVDTRFPGEAGQYAGYAQQLETIGLTQSAVADGAHFVVLPESAAGFWTPTVERLWKRGLAGTDAKVIVGAAVVGQTGYSNVMMAISSEGAKVLYRERMPVPVSMWQPWLALAGQRGGASVDFFGNPVVQIAGTKIAPLICYEQLLVWPVLQSKLHGPDVIVAIGNDWWTENTSIAAIQKASTQAWASLFSVPLVVAFNY